jgi:hypothetical protein
VRGAKGVWTLDLSGLKISDPENRKFDVVASTRDSEKIGKHIDKTDPYYPAVVDWLHKNYEEGDIRLAEYWSSGNDKPVRKADGSHYLLSLKQMYWLDISPVGRPNSSGNSEWALKGCMSDSPYPISVTNSATGMPMTNVRCTVTMMITNFIDGAAATYAPYMLRGLKPGSTSYDYDEHTSENWDSVTFKITGVMVGGVGVRRPLRWFTLGPDSFTNNFTSVIEVADPFSQGQPGYSYGWYKYPGSMIAYGWSISDDTNRPPISVYQLNDENALLDSRRDPVPGGGN